VHVRACVCARRAIDLLSWPANWTATIGSTTGQHHWPALITPLASSTGHHHWSAPLAGNIGQDPWQHVTNTSIMTMLMILVMMIMATMTIMIMMLIMIRMMMMMLMGMMVMGMMNAKYIRTCACMGVHAAQ
jgi:hypothetical protein